MVAVLTRIVGSVVFERKLEKKKLTDIGLWLVFSWIPDFLQKLTGRLFSRIKFDGLFSWYWIWIDIVYQSTSDAKLVRRGFVHKRRTAPFLGVDMAGTGA